MEPRLTGNYQQLTTTLSSLLPPPMDFKHIFHDAATLNTVNSRLFPSRNLFLFRPPPHPNPHPTPNFPITFMRRTLPETIFRLNCNSWNSWHLKGVSNEQTFFSHYRKLFGYLWKTRDISPLLIPVLALIFFPGYANGIIHHSLGDCPPLLSYNF